MSQLTKNSTAAEILQEIDLEHERIIAALGQFCGEWDQEEKDRYDELVEERLEMVAARNWLMRKCKE